MVNVTVLDLWKWERYNTISVFLSIHPNIHLSIQERQQYACSLSGGTPTMETYTKLFEVWEWFMCDSDVIAFCYSNSTWRHFDKSNKFKGWPWTSELINPGERYFILYIPEGSSIINTGLLEKHACSNIFANYYLFVNCETLSKLSVLIAVKACPVISKTAERESGNVVYCWLLVAVAW